MTSVFWFAEAFSIIARPMADNGASGQKDVSPVFEGVGSCSNNAERSVEEVWVHCRLRK